MPSTAISLAPLLAEHIEYVGPSHPWDEAKNVRKLNTDLISALPRNFSADQLAQTRAHLHYAIASAAHVPESEEFRTKNAQMQVHRKLLDADRLLYDSCPSGFEEHAYIEPRYILDSSKEALPQSPRRATFEAIMPDLWNAASAMSRIPKQKKTDGMPQSPNLPDLLHIAMRAKEELIIPNRLESTIREQELQPLRKSYEQLEDTLQQLGFAKCTLQLRSENRQLAASIERDISEQLSTLGKLTNNHQQRSLASADRFFPQGDSFANQFLYEARNSLIRAFVLLLKVDSTQVHPAHANSINQLLENLHTALESTAELTDRNAGTHCEAYSTLLQAEPEVHTTSWVGAKRLSEEAPNQRARSSLHTLATLQSEEIHERITQIIQSLRTTPGDAHLSLLCEASRYARHAFIEGEPIQADLARTSISLMHSEEQNIRISATELMVHLLGRDTTEQSPNPVQAEIMTHLLGYMAQDKDFDYDREIAHQVISRGIALANNERVPAQQRLLMVEHLFLLSQQPLHAPQFSDANGRELCFAIATLCKDQSLPKISRTFLASRTCNIVENPETVQGILDSENANQLFSTQHENPPSRDPLSPYTDFKNFGSFLAEGVHSLHILEDLASEREPYGSFLHFGNVGESSGQGTYHSFPQNTREAREFRWKLRSFSRIEDEKTLSDAITSVLGQLPKAHEALAHECLRHLVSTMQGGAQKQHLIEQLGNHLPEHDMARAFEELYQIA